MKACWQTDQFRNGLKCLWFHSLPSTFFDSLERDHLCFFALGYRLLHSYLSEQFHLAYNLYSNYVMVTLNSKEEGFLFFYFSISILVFKNQGEKISTTSSLMLDLRKTATKCMRPKVKFEFTFMRPKNSWGCKGCVITLQNLAPTKVSKNQNKSYTWTHWLFSRKCKYVIERRQFCKEFNSNLWYFQEFHDNFENHDNDSRGSSFSSFAVQLLSQNCRKVLQRNEFQPPWEENWW